MNVTGANTNLLFCEGEPFSLDSQLLSRLLKGKAPTTLIVPAGGKQGLRSFIRGRLAGYQNPPPYLAFRDRDFDVEPPDDASLIAPDEDRPLFLAYRAAIENYLLDAALIDDYWTYHDSESGPRWQHGPSQGASSIQSWMNDAAAQISDYEAVRWALSRLKPGDRWPELGTRWTKQDGALPSSLSRDDCLENAKALLDAYRESTSRVTEERFLELFSQYSARFTVTEFIDGGQYLIWFHGKDLAKAMQQMRPNWISMRHFFGWAVQNVDWSRHADLLELAGKM